MASRHKSHPPLSRASSALRPEIEWALHFFSDPFRLVPFCCCDKTPQPRVIYKRKRSFRLRGSRGKISEVKESIPCGRSRKRGSHVFIHMQEASEREQEMGIELWNSKVHPQWCIFTSKAPPSKGSINPPKQQFQWGDHVHKCTRLWDACVCALHGCVSPFSDSFEDCY